MTRFSRRMVLAGVLALIAAPQFAQTLPPRGGGGTRGDGGGNRTSDPAPPARGVARQGNGRFEYVVSTPGNQAVAAAAALQNLGAVLLRDTNLPNLGRRLLIFGFPNGLTLATARATLAGAAPGAQLDLHLRYRFAGGPRLYAAALLGEAGALPCRLGRAVRIGLIDGPIAAHPALAGANVTQYSVLRAGESPPSADHATAIAGLMVGEDASGALAGFAQGATLTAVSAFTRASGQEGADVERIGMAMDLLLGAGVRLVNMSFAGPPNQALADLLAQALGKGMVIVAAVGNDGGSATTLPAAMEGVIGVTAVDAATRRYGKANTGAGVDFAAPGVELYAAKGAKGGYVSGTSFAAPIVTAYVARLMAGGTSSAASLRRALAAGAADIGKAGADAEFGLGLVQAPACR